MSIGGFAPVRGGVMNIKRNEKGIWWMPWH
jgi:hypothetical protein